MLDMHLGLIFLEYIKTLQGISWGSRGRTGRPQITINNYDFSLRQSPVIGFGDIVPSLAQGQLPKILSDVFYLCK